MIVTGPAGSGKSDLVLRLIDRGFLLVADDGVEVENGIARTPAVTAGMIEVRGLGILRLPWASESRLVLAVDLSRRPPRLPEPAREAVLGLPVIALDPFEASAAQRVDLALDCALGKVAQVAGAFAA